MKMGKMLKISLALAFAASLLAGCASTPSADEQAAAAAKAAAEAKCADASKAIADAKAAVESASKAGSTWRDTEDLIGQAEKAQKDGDCGKAIDLANQARRQAENAVKQAEAEKARLASSAAGTKTSAGAADYTVVRGDSLWRIAGKSEIYGNPYQWPLLYKANRSKIKDADLIHPGQKLSVDRKASAADIKAAVNHAKTRGAWSLGVVEDSDRAYLGK